MADEQILAQAVLEKAPSARGGITAEQAAHAANVRKNMPSDTLSGVRASIIAVRDVDVAASSRSLDSDFGIDRDPTTGAKKRDASAEPGVDARYVKAEKATKQVQELLGSGITTDRAGVVTKMEAVLTRLPGYDTYLTNLPSGELTLVIDSMMKDPKFLEKARLGYEKWVAESSRLKDNVTDAQKKFEEAEAARAKKEAEKIDVSQKLSDIRDTERSFTDRRKSPTDPMTKADELDELQHDSAGNPRDLAAEESSASRQVTQWRTRLESRIKTLAALEAQGKKAPSQDWIDANQAVIDADIEVGNAEKASAKAKIDRRRRDELEKEKAELPGKIKALEADEIRLTTEYNTAEIAKLSVQATLHQEKIARMADEEGRAADADRIITDALLSYLDEQTQVATDANRAYLDKLEADAKTSEDKKIVKQIKERYLKKTFDLLGREKRVFDKGQAKADVRFLMGGGTPDKMVQAALEAAYPGDPNKVADLMAKPDFVEQYGIEAVKQAFMRYVGDGGGVTPAMEAYINAQPWGKGLVDALATAPSVQSLEKSLKEKGILAQGGFKELLKNNKGKIGLGILLMLALGLLAPTAIPMIAGAAGAAA